jgi:hypothetical protein
VITGQVQNDRSKIGGSLRLILNSRGRSGKAQKSLLHDVFSSISIIDEKPSEPNQ